MQQAALCAGWVPVAGVLAVWAGLLLRRSEARVATVSYLISQALLWCMALAGVGVAQTDRHQCQELAAEHICRGFGPWWVARVRLE